MNVLIAPPQRGLVQTDGVGQTLQCERSQCGPPVATDEHRCDEPMYLVYEVGAAEA